MLGFVGLEAFHNPGARGALGWALRWNGWKCSSESSELDKMGGSLMSIYKEPTHYSLELGPITVSGDGNELVRAGLELAAALFRNANLTIEVTT
jgi:hypothetical protein